MEDKIQVTEKVAAFIDWAKEKGEDEVRRMVRERLAILAEECAKTANHTDSEGLKWDDAMEPNDSDNQWKHGGDCNICRKVGYCGTQCRANKLLKKVTTPFLYRCYVEEHPEAAMEEVGKSITPEDVVAKLGVQ